MRYDPSRPVAVFLGPSVDRATAEKILPANYYPPVRMGDVYRLAATGVRTILIIDGVFHWVTPVWQREIRSALESGIVVIGAASMGALRAAELGRFGMIGRGTIWSWYRDLIVDGDDEVALMHGDETVNYRPMSEPLVNIRYNLARAVERGVIDQRHAQQLVDRTKERYFGARSYRVLLNDARSLEIGEEQMTRLERFLGEEAVDLKRCDAIEALTYCAELAAASDAASSSPAFVPPSVPPSDPETDGGYSAIASLRRGVPARNGELLTAESVLQRISSQPEWLLGLRHTVAAGFFLSQWAADHGVDAPEPSLQRFRRCWVDTQVKGELATWLATVGLTAAEFEAEMRRRATIDWLLTSDPGALGLDFEPHRQCVALLSARLAASPVAAGGVTARAGEDGDRADGDHAAVRRKLAEACYVAAWARERGIDCPRETAAEFVETCEAQWGITSRPEALKSVELDESGYLDVLSQRACYHWAVEHGPNFFGYSTFSYPQALLTELQVTGGISALVDAEGDTVITAPSLPAQYCHGTYRLLSPEATLARVAPLLDACGITRCADVTQLDTLGIPVYCAIRPAATVQQISNGKGLTAAGAKVSALMEAIELFHAESPDAGRLSRASVRTLRADGGEFLAPPDIAGFEAAQYYSESFELEWIEGTDLGTGARVQVPASAVFFHRRPHLHVTTTNGLASGNHTIEATLHALYEVIERNAAAELLGHKRIPISTKCRVLALDSIDDPGLRTIVDRVDTAESHLVVLQVGHDMAVPTFWAVLLSEESMISGSTFNTGWGTHLDPSVAVSRAVTEAAQSRATMIHGGREDCLAKPVFGDAVSTRSSAAYQFFRDLRSNITWAELSREAIGNDLAEHHAAVIEQLARAGHRRVVLCDLTKPAIGISVVKVIVPSLRLHAR